jgi:hypothetical protein
VNKVRNRYNAEYLQNKSINFILLFYIQKQGLRSLRELTNHITTRADDSHATPVLAKKKLKFKFFYDTSLKIISFG